jgi:LacI family repressor for deo operon, udp, cdd, tsx, nupC, and nupG
MRVTLKSIAEETGISISTVSRAVIGKGYVSADARAAVQEAVARLGYAPPRQAEARQLPQELAQEQTVLVIIGGLRSSIATDYVEHLVRDLVRKHKTPMIAVSGFSSEEERKLLQYAARNHFFGVMMLSITEHPETAALLRKMPCPVVFLGQYLPLLEIDFLHPDYYKMGFIAAEHLIARGHSQIAFIGGSEHSSITQDKQLGLEDCLHAHGLTLDPQMIMRNDRLLYENGKRAAQWLLDLPRHPTAVLTSNDISVGLLDELLRMGFHLPRDLSIFNCDDTPMSATCRVPLTVTCSDTGRITAEAVRVLCRRKRNPSCPRSYLIFDPLFVERESVCAPRSADRLEAP